MREINIHFGNERIKNTSELRIYWSEPTYSMFTYQKTTFLFCNETKTLRVYTPNFCFILFTLLYQSAMGADEKNPNNSKSH